MKPVVFTFPTPDLAAVCTIQSTAGAGSLIINGTLSGHLSSTFGNLIAGNNSAYSYVNHIGATFNGFSSVVSITSIHDLSAVNFTISGFLDGLPVSETINGPMGTGVPVVVYSTEIFSIVTSITVDGAVNAVSIGTGTSGKTNWFGYDHYRHFSGLAIQGHVTTANYDFITTLDDVQKTPYANLTLFTPITAMTGATTNILASYMVPTLYACMRINNLTGVPVGGAATGSLIATFVQQGTIL